MIHDRTIEQIARDDATAPAGHAGRWRGMDPSLGRWTRQDPAGYIDGGNLYLAFGDSPIRYVDPFGLEKEDCGEDCDPLFPDATPAQIKKMQERFGDVADDIANRLYPDPGGAFWSALAGPEVWSDEYRAIAQQERRRNALRHCLRACMMAVLFGSKKTLASLDERETGAHKVLKPQDTSTDKANNATGAAFGELSCGTPGERGRDCFRDCHSALQSGTLDTTSAVGDFYYPAKR